MSYLTTLRAVRELSEHAMLRPASKRLLFATPPAPLVRPAIICYEETHRPRISGSGTAHGRRPDSRKPRDLDAA